MANVRQIRSGSKHLFNRTLHLHDQKIKDILLRSETGVSILAVSRAGRVYYDPQPDYQIYPGDRLIIMGSVEELCIARH
jgi:K+/H+ antiporter YhaU regulatory subunit KhtT